MVRDPRIQRTMEAIRAAAMALLRDEGVGALSTVRVCREAQVARSTFYEHYRAPWEPAFEALQRSFFERFPEYREEASLLDPQSLLASGKPLSFPMFAHIEEHVDLYRRIFETEAGASLVRALERAVQTVSRKQHAALRQLSSVEIDAERTAAYLAGALVATARHWVSSEPRESATQLSYWFSRMAAPGLLQIMGLEALLE
ncbi:MAG: TetR/AcrR family transcriptional regulator [Spirochaetota bacterium]